MIAESLKSLSIPITSIKPDPRNARTHPKPNLDTIKRSLEAYGQRKPIVVNVKTGHIEAGDGLFLAAKKLGWTEIAAVKVEDDKDTATGFALMDNQSALLAGWDMPVSTDLVKELNLADFDLNLTGFDATELQKLLGGKLGLTDDDAVPEHVETICKPGDLWRLGADVKNCHYLLCG